jgi:hypothetical protein
MMVWICQLYLSNTNALITRALASFIISYGIINITTVFLGLFLTILQMNLGTYGLEKIRKLILKLSIVFTGIWILSIIILFPITVLQTKIFTWKILENDLYLAYQLIATTIVIQLNYKTICRYIFTNEKITTFFNIDSEFMNTFRSEQEELNHSANIDVGNVHVDNYINEIVVNRNAIVVSEPEITVEELIIKIRENISCINKLDSNERKEREESLNSFSLHLEKVGDKLYTEIDAGKITLLKTICIEMTECILLNIKLFSHRLQMRTELNNILMNMDKELKRNITKTIINMKKRRDQLIIFNLLYNINKSLLFDCVIMCTGKIPLEIINNLINLVSNKDSISKDTLNNILKRCLKILDRKEISKEQLPHVNFKLIKNLIYKCASVLEKNDILLRIMITPGYINDIDHKDNAIYKLTEFFFIFKNEQDKIVNAILLNDVSVKSNAVPQYNHAFDAYPIVHNCSHVIVPVDFQDKIVKHDPLQLPLEVLDILTKKLLLPVDWIVRIVSKYPKIIESQIPFLIDDSKVKLFEELKARLPDLEFIRMIELGIKAFKLDVSKNEISDNEWLSLFRFIDMDISIISKFNKKYTYGLPVGGSDWIISKLIDYKYYDYPSLQNIHTCSIIQFKWNSQKSWDLLRANKNWRKFSPLTVSNGEGYDAGGISRSFNWDLGIELRNKFSNFEGYILPVLDMSLDEAHDIGFLLGRCLINGKNYPIGLDLHPVIYYFCGACYYLEHCSLEIIEYSLGHDILYLLSPKTIYNKTPETLTADIMEKYEKWMPLISEIARGFLLFTKNVNNKRRINSCSSLITAVYGTEIRLDGSEGLFSKLVIHGDGKEEYLEILKIILHSWTSIEVNELYRFWFGCPKPNFTNNFPSISVTKTVGLAQAATCSYMLRLPYYEQLHGDELRIAVEKCLRDTLAEQLAAEKHIGANQYSMI